MTTYQSASALPAGVIDPNANDPVFDGQLLSPADYAMIGGSLGQAGYSQDAISSLMGAIERSAVKAAQQAARAVAFEMLPLLTAAIQATHTAATGEIYRQITNRMGGVGGVLGHRQCAQIALNVGAAAPRQTPVPAQPIVGTIRR